MVAITLQGDRIDPGQTIFIRVEASDDRAVSALSATLDGAPLPLDANGFASFTGGAPGRFVIAAVATDAAGNVGAAEAVVVVGDPGDVDAPTVAFTGPEIDALVDGTVVVSGTATDANLELWQIALRRKGSDGDWAVLAEGYEPVEDDVFAALDPTTWPDGLYDLRVLARDVNGLTVTLPRSIEIETGDVKPGVFELELADLRVRMGGLPITVGRRYDSTVRTVEDFGRGWDLTVSQGAMEGNQPVSGGWEVVQGGGILGLPCGRAQELRPHVIRVQVSRSEIYWFGVEVTPTSGFPISGFCQVTVGFSPLRSTEPGVANLVNLGGATAVYQPGTDFLAVDIDQAETAYQVSRARLETPDGRTFVMQGDGRVLEMADPNGNRLEIREDGIFHSRGASVAFARDGEGRITAVTDPLGGVIRYAYDEDGRLLSVTDRTGGVTRYDYEGHLLTGITDPLGQRIATQQYDEAGRLIGLAGGAGATTSLTHDLDNSREIVVDAAGNTETTTHDDMGNEVSKVDALGRTTTTAYDAEGNVLSITDAAGNVQRRSYDAQGYLAGVELPGGVSHAWTNDAAGRPTSITYGNGSTFGYGYDAAGNKTAFTDPEGNVVAFDYDASGNRTGLTHADGSTESFAYDASGRMTRRTDELGHVTEWAYDALGRQTAESRQVTIEGEVVTLESRWVYDAEGRLTEQVHPDGARERWAYDAAGRMVAYTDPAGARTAFERDTDGRPTRVIYADGTEVRTTYDAEGRWLTRVGRDGQEEVASYDAAGRPTRRALPGDRSVDLAYDVRDGVSAYTDPSGEATTYEYDDLGRISAQIDALGRRTEFAYDALGNLLQHTAPGDRVTTYTYDAANRAASKVNPDGGETRWTYDSRGRVATRVTADGGVYRYGYDAANRVTQVTDPLGGITRMTYDERGLPLTVTDANGHTTTMVRDAGGRVSKIIDALGNVERYSYDVAGRVIARTDGRGLTTTFTYDVEGRMLTRTTPDEAVTRFEYDAAGRRTAVEDTRGRTTYAYDAAGNMIRRVEPDGAAVEHTYDEAGRLLSTTTAGHTLNYTYDALGRLSAVGAFGDEITYAYGDQDQPTEVRWPNGVVATSGYDAAGHLVAYRLADADDNDLERFEHSYDLMGRRTQTVEHVSGATVDYTYDALGRLLSETRTVAGAVVASATYTYDAVGNRTRLVDHTGRDIAYSYDDADRLVQAGIVDYEHDAAGNLVAWRVGGQEVRLDFDGRGQLIGFTQNGQTVAYDYDADGNRVARAADGATGAALWETPAPFPRLLTETDGDGGVSRYAYGVGPVAMQKDGAVRYLHGDGGNTVRMTTDGGGAVTGQAVTDAFGVPVATTGEGVSPLKHRGEWQDPDTGLYDLHARWYAPEIGRFVSADRYPAQASDPNTLHRYAYVMNDPVNLADPTGEYFWIVKKILGLLIRAIGGGRSAAGGAAAVGGFDVVGYVGARYFGTSQKEYGIAEMLEAEEVWFISGALAIVSGVVVSAAVAAGAGLGDASVNGAQSGGRTFKAVLGASNAGGNGDAMRHCTWNALMTAVLGRRQAERIATAHEEPPPFSGNGGSDSLMDLHNNARGRQMPWSGLLEDPKARGLLGGITTAVNWPGASAFCMRQLLIGDLQILNKTRDPWVRVPSYSHFP